MKPWAIFLLLLCSLAFADPLAEQLADYSVALDATVAVPDAKLTESPQVILVKINANNIHTSAMPLYVLREDASGWQMVKLLGALPPDKRTTVELEVEVEYGKQTEKRTRYAVVGRGEDNQLYGTTFEIVEDWSEYEGKISDSLSSALVVIVPIIGVILVALAAFVAYTAFRSKSPEERPGEYTLKTLMMPIVEGRPFEEKLADVMIHPLAMAFEVACILLLAFVMHEGLSEGGGNSDALAIMLLSGLCAFSIPFAYFAAAWYFEKREEGKPLRFFAGMFFWGMLAAFLSLIISSAIAGELKYALAIPFAVVATTMIAPVVEETLKALGVLFISGHHEYNDTLTGLLLGFTCGVGFAFVENWFYFASKATPFEIGPAAWVTLVLYRSFLNTLAHGCFTAAVSTLIGYLRGVSGLHRLARLAIVPGIFIAVAIHVIFNLSALADSFVIANRQALFYVFNPMLIILLAAMFFLVLVLAIIEEKKRKIRPFYYGEHALPS